MLSLQKNEKVSIIICLYGLYDKNIRSRKEMEGYDEYLSQCAQLIEEYALAEKLEHVVLAGGFTNTMRPGTSEAQSVMEKIMSLTDHVMADFDFLLEEGSINTPQNILFGLRLIPESKKAIVVCDNHRREKTVEICKYVYRLIKKRTQIFLKTFSRKDIHPNSAFWKQKLQAIGFQLIPGLIWYQLKKRKQKLFQGSMCII